MIPISIVFLIVGVVFLLCAIYAPLSDDGVLLSPPDIAYYVSKSILVLLSAIYIILFMIVLLNYLNRRIFLSGNTITYINYLGFKTVLEPNKCEIKVLHARFDLYSKETKKKICTISFMNDGDIFEFIKKIERIGVTRKF